MSFSTNVFGPLNVARAFLPYLRAQRTGTVLWVGSLGAWLVMPSLGLYMATKLAVRGWFAIFWSLSNKILIDEHAGLSETLHAEISPLGLRSICFEPGGFRTAALKPDHRTPYDPRITDYAEITKGLNDALVGL